MEKIEPAYKIVYFLEEIDNKKAINNFETTFSLKLPFLYKEISKNFDGVCLERSVFSYFDDDGTLIFDGLGGFLCWNSQKDELIMDAYINSPPEFFPKGLVPFDNNGGGDYICFDYRNCRENPPVVIWKHERNPGEDVFFIAHTFDDFIESLQKDEEVEW